MPAVVAWLAVVVSLVVDLSGPLALVGVLAAIVVASFGVMHRADALARRLGEPFGTIILTLSIVVIEVALIVSVLLGPGDHSTIARDTTISSVMLLLNFILGVAVLLGGLRHGTMTFNATGASQYATMLLVLGAVTYVAPLPALFQAFLIGGSYVFFMWRQLGANAGDFANPQPTERSDEPVGSNVAWLLATLVPIVFLSHAMSPLLDAAVPSTALAGLLLAAVALLPETFTTFKAGWDGQLQRVSNLTHGAAVSVVGATIPTVLLVTSITGQEAVLQASSTELGLLGLTMALMVTILAGRQATAVHGVGHLTVFGLYLLLL